jgi:uncharacterized membrane protein YoaK (UPF0700 family)
MHLLLVLLSFVAGAAFSGLFIGSSALQPGRRYGAALLVEAGLLLLAMLALQASSLSGHYLASAACGLQNAMVTTYSGAIIRTTHVSGIFTDLGVMLGARLRGVPLDRRKAVLFLLLIGGFILGGHAGGTGLCPLAVLFAAGACVDGGAAGGDLSGLGTASWYCGLMGRGRKG